MYTLDYLNDGAFSSPLSRYAVDMVADGGMLFEDTSHDCFSRVAGASALVRRCTMRRSRVYFCAMGALDFHGSRKMLRS